MDPSGGVFRPSRGAGGGEARTRHSLVITSPRDIPSPASYCEKTKTSRGLAYPFGVLVADCRIFADMFYSHLEVLTQVLLQHWYCVTNVHIALFHLRYCLCCIIIYRQYLRELILRKWTSVKLLPFECLVQKPIPNGNQLFWYSHRRTYSISSK